MSNTARVVALVLALAGSIAEADPKSWSVDVPGDWYQFSLPVITQRVQKLRAMKGIKRLELASYSAGGGGVLVVVFVLVDPPDSPSRGTLADLDDAIRQGQQLPGSREIHYTSDVVDDQLVTRVDEEIPGGAFRDLRIAGIDGQGLVHILAVTCFSPNNAFEACGRIQQSARLTPPEPRSLGRSYNVWLIGGLVAAGLILVWFLTRRRAPREPSSAPRPVRAHPASGAPPGPEYTARSRGPSRMPSSIPLDGGVREHGTVAASVRKNVESHAQRSRISYATNVIEVSSSGIVATRDDGQRCHVSWTEVVGVVVRRFPSVAPYDGGTFVDLVSVPGSTLRLMPSTQVTGVDIFGSPESRARSFVKLISARCPGARLDAATSTFVDAQEAAAQLPDIETLAEHDRRLA